MTREEAIKVANEMYGWVKTDREREALETLVPELAESEDERIRKELIEFIKWSVDRHFMREDFHQAKRPSEWIAYLEKREEQKSAEWSEEDERIMNGIQLVLESWDRSHVSSAGLPSLVPKYISWLKSLRPNKQD